MVLSLTKCFVEYDNVFYNVSVTHITVGTELATPLNGFVTVNGTTFFEYSDKILQVTVNSTSRILQIVSALPLPITKSYLKLFFSSSFQFGYIDNRPDIVLIKQCSGLSCLSYNCQDPHCSDCSLNAAICLIC